MTTTSRRRGRGSRSTRRRVRPRRAGALALGVLACALAGAEECEPPPGPFFEDATAASGVAHLPDRGSGVAVGDVDGDGDPDLFLTDSVKTALYLNDGDGTFTDVTDAWNADLTWALGATFADYDADGDPDLLIARAGPNTILRNDGGVFTDVGAAAGFDDPLMALNVALADFDGDGDLDAHVANYLGGPSVAGADVLYRNEGDGTFTDVTGFLDGDWIVGTAYLSGWTDVDHDGDPDLYVVNDFSFLPGDTTPNQLWRNDGPDGSGGWLFTRVSETCGCGIKVAGMGLAIGDYDRDGWQDLYVSSAIPPEGGLPPNPGEQLLHNLGGGLFEEVSLAVGAKAYTQGDPKRTTSWAVEFLDVDNDAWQDLFVVFGQLVEPDPALQPNVLLHNDGGTFSTVPDSGADDTELGRGIGVVDYDADGCLDIVLAHIDTAPRVYRNLCASENHWVGIRLEGKAPNLEAVGAVVTLYTPDGARQRAEVVAGSTSVHSSRWKTLHWGLGANESALAHVRWPDGRTELRRVPAVDRYLTFAQP